MKRFTILCFLCSLLLNAGAQTMLEANGLALLKTKPLAALLVDTLLDYHAQTLNQKYNTNLIQSDVWGNTGNWSVTSSGGIAPNILSNIVVPSFALAQRVKTPDGTIFSATPALGVREDLAQGAAGTMELQYNFSGSGIVDAQLWLMFTNLSAPAQNSRDLNRFPGNPYGVSQFNIYDNNPNNQQVTSGIHTSLAGAFPSTVQSVPTNIWWNLEMCEDITNGLAFVTYRNATNNAFLFSSIGYGTPAADQQTTFEEFAGYIYIATINGYIHRAPSIFSAGSHVLTNRPPWLPTAPSGVSGSQVGNAIVVNWTDNSLMLNSNRVSVSNATDGELVGWVSPASNSIVIGSETGGTYDVRAATYFLNGVHSSIVSGGTVVFNPPTLYESYAFASSDSFVDQADQQWNYAAAVTESAGICSKVVVGISNVFSSPVSFKIAIFDFSGNLVTSWTTDTTSATGAIQFTLPTPLSVSSGFYYVGVSANCNSGTIDYFSSSAHTDALQCTSPGNAWSGYPPSSLGPTFNAFVNRIYVGMIIQ